jgi:DNA polymerase-1
MSEALKDKALRSVMVLSVHDEIVFEVPEPEINQMFKLVPEIMENVWQLDVPLRVNVAVGQNWAEVH